MKPGYGETHVSNRGDDVKQLGDAQETVISISKPPTSRVTGQWTQVCMASCHWPVGAVIIP